MKIVKEVKEVNIGVSVFLSNIELMVLNSEVNKLLRESVSLKQAMEGKSNTYTTVNVTKNTLVNILKFLEKFTHTSISLEEIHSELFVITEKTKEQILDIEVVNERIEESFNTYTNSGINV